MKLFEVNCVVGWITVNDRISPQFRIAPSFEYLPLSIKPPGVKAILRNKPPFE